MARRSLPPEKKQKRPQTIAEARRLIEETMKVNNWDKAEQKIYQQMIGVSGFVSAEDVRRTVEDLERSHMVLFED